MYVQEILMKFSGKKRGAVMLLMAFLLTSVPAQAQVQTPGDQASGMKNELSAAVPELSEIIPLSTKLYGRLAVLENAIRGVLDVSEFQKKYAEIEKNLKGTADHVQQLKDSKVYRYRKLLELRDVIEQENEVFEEVSIPLRQAINRMGKWRKEWLAEKKNWNAWQSSLLEEGEFPKLRPVFAEANDTIDAALNLVLPKLEEMISVQEEAGTVQKKIKSLAAELDGLILGKKRSFLLDVSPPMFSSRYFSQFGSQLWDEVRTGIDEIPWPGMRYFGRHGWIVLFQVFLSLFVIIALYRNRKVLLEDKSWRFLAERPVASGIFIGMMATLVLYRYGSAQPAWELANSIAGGISFALLFGFIIRESWKRHFVYGLITIFIVMRAMYVGNLPLPLVRLSVVLISLASLFSCLRWVRESGRQEGSGLYTWSLRLSALFFAAIMIAEIWGKTNLPLYLLATVVQVTAAILVFLLFMHIVRGGVEWLFRTSSFRRAALVHTDYTDAIIRNVTWFIDAAIVVLALIPALLMISGVYDNLEKATKGVLAFGFTVGSQRISMVLIITAVCMLYASFLISWIFQKAIMDKVLVRRNMERGVRLAIGRLVHYAFIFTGFLLAISTLGVEITKLTIMLSALGVGIGFGLQGVVNNFVSGLILLFERPIRVGDFIEFGGKWSEVKSIGLRSTTVQTFDSSDVIIPNADLISNQVTNWTLNNRRRRLDIPVGVAYGSDIPRVIETLLASAGGNTLLAETPAPQVLFLRFGESSLDFELRVFVSDVRNSMNVISALHEEIIRRFREARIEIAFPQRDLHVRSIDDPVIVRPPETRQ